MQHISSVLAHGHMALLHRDLGPPIQSHRLSVVPIGKCKAEIKHDCMHIWSSDREIYHCLTLARENRGTHIMEGILDVGEKAVAA